MDDDDDDLLRRLAEVEREHEARYPHPWEAVIAGDLDPEAARAARAGIDPAEDVELHADLFTPLGEDETAAMVERMAAALASADQTHTTPPSADANADADADASAAPVISLAERAARRRRGLLGGASALVAAAAALALWIQLGDPAAREGGEGEALVPYSLMVRNQELRPERSADAAHEGPARYRRDSAIHWVLRPDEAIARPEGLGLEIWAGEGAGARRLAPTAGVTISEQGVVELRGTLGELLPLAPGRWSLRFVVGVDLGELKGEPPAAADDPRARVIGPYEIEIVE